MGRAGTVEGSQLVVGVSLYGAEPSGGGCIAPPGQRWLLLRSSPVSRAAGSIGVIWLVPAFNENALKIGWMRA